MARSLTSAQGYQPPLDDILFSLEHMAGGGALPAWDTETLREIIEPYSQLMAAEIAPLNESGDRQGAVLENGRVRLPDGFVDAYRTYAEQGWQGLTLPEIHGGQGLDEMGLGNLSLALTAEVMSGANHAFQMMVGLAPGLARVLIRFGSEDQKQRYLSMIASGVTLNTMALTEPQAGSDLSRISCRAEDVGSAWQLTGEKIFISNGDQDASERITHLVLARTSDAGIKGLSLFLCPSHLADGSRNRVQILRLEDKLGVKASPTCHMAFDQAEAELIGERGQGLVMMFTMMNHARLDVALQGVAHASRAHQLAASHAAERVQAGKPIAEHADVARMLTDIERLAWGARALAHLGTVELDKGVHPALLEVLTPLIKVYCTTAGTKAADLAIQVLGGYGYLKDYGVEQILRDSRICAIYEGTNGIHEASLVTRHLNAGRPYDELEALFDEAPALDADLASWCEDRRRLEHVGDAKLLANSFTNYTVCLLLQLLWHRAEQAANSAPQPEKIPLFKALAAIDFTVARTRFTAELEWASTKVGG